MSKTNIENFNKRLEKHCFLEYFFGKVSNSDKIMLESYRPMLLEKHGVMNDMDKYCNAVIDFVKKNVDFSHPNEARLTMTREDFPFETFFDNCLGEIEIKVTNNKNLFSRTGAYKSGLAKYVNNEYNTNFKICLIGDYDYIINMIPITVSHELTHAYDDYSRISHKQEKMLNVGYKRNYYTANELSESDMYENCIIDLIYNTANTEINAFIAQAQNEMAPYIAGTSSSSEAYEAIKQTSIYHRLTDLIETYKILGSILGNDFLEDAMGKKFLEAYNKAATKSGITKLYYGYKDNPIKTFKGFYRYYGQKILRLKNRVLTVLPKMAYDLYCEVGDKGTDYNREI